VIELILDRYVYWVVLALLAIGLYGIFALGNLARKLIGLVVFSTAIYLFFIHGSLETGATAPVIDPDLGTDPGLYVDPLPHLLILTAIVVGVGVLGVGLSLLVRIYRTHGTFDEAIIAERLSGRASPLGTGDEAESEGGEVADDRGGEVPDGRGGGAGDLGRGPRDGEGG
jgi:multicomponent Na+:H+ antiporter subunit C